MNKIDFEYPGKKCTVLKIAQIEKTLGKKLPKAYKDLIKRCGGGVLSLENNPIRLPMDDSSEVYELDVEQIFGNGKTSSGDDNDLLTFGRFLTEEYEIPDELLLFGFCESGMHEYLVINYGMKGFPEGSILYCNDEENPGEYIQIAPSFAEFLDLIEPELDVSESTEDGDPDRIHERSMDGTLAP